MRSRSRVRSMFVPLAIVGVLGAASVASAGTDTTTPEDTAAAGTEPAGTEPTGSAPEGGGAGAGAGSGADSGIEGADLAGTEVSMLGVESPGRPRARTCRSRTQRVRRGQRDDDQLRRHRDFEDDIGTQVAAATPPDIAAFPQPGCSAGSRGAAMSARFPTTLSPPSSENWPAGWMSFGNVDGTQYGVPMKSDLKSLVWYMPACFAEKGYEVPTTLDDFFALTEQMIANGNTPLCVGIEDGAATGWPFTDWVEELVLRNQGIDFYNQWVAHEIPFNSPEVVDDDASRSSTCGTPRAWCMPPAGRSTARRSGETATPLVDGDCMMHRQASFYRRLHHPQGAEFGEEEGQVDTFYFPANEGSPTLVGGIVPAAFRDAPEVWAVMQYLASPEFANARQAAQAELIADGGMSGFLTANLNADHVAVERAGASVHRDAADRPTRLAFDASDQMPGRGRSRHVLVRGDALVNGDVDAQEAADNIEASWPPPADPHGGSDHRR